MINPIPFTKVLAVAVVCAVGLKSAEPAFSVHISAPENIKAGFGPTVTVVLTNNTDQPADVGIWGPQAERYQIDVRDAMGNPPGKTRLYRALTGDRTGKDAVEPPDATLMGPLGGSFGNVSVMPGKSFTEKIFLNQLFDVAQPGKYTVRLQWTNETQMIGFGSNRPAVETKTAAVTSNTITFTVTP